jgi:hypothetical protein
MEIRPRSLSLRSSGFRIFPVLGGSIKTLHHCINVVYDVSGLSGSHLLAQAHVQVMFDLVASSSPIKPGVNVAFLQSVEERFARCAGKFSQLICVPELEGYCHAPSFLSEACGCMYERFRWDALRAKRCYSLGLVRIAGCRLMSLARIGPCPRNRRGVHST